MVPSSKFNVGHTLVVKVENLEYFIKYSTNTKMEIFTT